MTFALDTSAPNMARIYNYWLGGKDNFAADRAEADRLVALYPPLPALVRENRQFLIKAVGWAARRGIGQFIDLGAGLPVSPSVHQAARAVLPAARVAYVDTDPVVLTFGQIVPFLMYADDTPAGARGSRARPLGPGHREAGVTPVAGAPRRAHPRSADPDRAAC